MTHSPNPDQQAQLRALPGVDVLLDQAEDLIRNHGRPVVASKIRAELQRRRAAVLAGRPVATEVTAVLADVVHALGEEPQGLRRVINATGVIVHTNLGRAPLSSAAVEAMTQAAGYCDVEFDLDTGQRGARGGGLAALLTEVTGAEAGFAVNNAAAALVLVVAALAGGRQVVVSRGELIEIGGSFRLPDILASAGAQLVEVGTTNRTRADDYHHGDDAGMLLKMHPSNYRVLGFTHAPSVAELAKVAGEREVPLVYDVGSGLLDTIDAPWAADEPSMRTALHDGADVVIASGDKLLGGPQAGLIVGSADIIGQCRRHPLARAMRLDKVRTAALVATLDAHRRDQAVETIPVWHMLSRDTAELERRCQALADNTANASVRQGHSVPGGGSAPGTTLPTPVVHWQVQDATVAAARLRHHRPPIVVRVENDEIVIDLRTVDPADDTELAQAMTTAAP